MVAAVFSDVRVNNLNFCFLLSFSWSLPMADLLPVKRECCQASARAVEWKGRSQQCRCV